MSDTPEAPDQPELIPSGPPAFCTVIAIDGRVVRVMPPEADGAVVVHITGRGTPLRFDRFQAQALRAGFVALPESV